MRSAPFPSLAFSADLSHVLILFLFLQFLSSPYAISDFEIPQISKISNFREMAGDLPSSSETEADESDSDFTEIDPSGRYGRVSCFLREFQSFPTTPFSFFF